MGKCCGVLVGCSVIMVILIAIGGYFGYNYLVTSGAEILANSIELDTAIIVDMVFEKDDQDEIMEAAKTFTNQIRSGEISMISLIREMGNNKESHVFDKAYLLGFKKQYLKTGEKLTEEEVVQGSNVINQILLAITNDSLENDQIASISELITYRHETKDIDSEEENASQSQPDQSTVTHIQTLLKPDLSYEQVAGIIAKMQKLVEENNLPAPDESFDFLAQLKNELLEMIIHTENSLKGDQ